MPMLHSASLLLALAACPALSFLPNYTIRSFRTINSPILDAPLGSDFERQLADGPMKTGVDGLTDANLYNVGLNKAAELWTVRTQVEKTAYREQGVPFLASKEKDFFVDDEQFIVGREGGLGMEVSARAI